MYANAIREHLLQHRAEHAAMVLDALALAGYQAGNELSVATALLNFAGEGIEMTAYALRKGLRQLQQLGLIAWRVYNNKKRGAPVTIYRLSPMKLIAEKLSVVMGAFDKITKAAVSHIRDYRAHLHRAFLARRDGEYSRRWLGARLGVSGRATYNYEKDFDDIQVTPRFHETEITWDNLDLLPFERIEGPVFLRIFIEVPLTEAEIAERYAAVSPIWRSILHKTRIEEHRFPAIRAIAVKLLRDGHTVDMIRQLSNYYRVKTELEMLAFGQEDIGMTRSYQRKLLLKSLMQETSEISHTSRIETQQDIPPKETDNPNLDTVITSKWSTITAAAAWSAAYHQMELQFDTISFDTFLRKAKLVDYEADTNIFTIEVHATYARDMLQYRLYRNVQRILRDVTGTEPAIRFICNAEAQSPEAVLRRFQARIQKST